MPDVVLIITMNEKMQVLVNGPIENKIVCFGMMEVAKEAIIAHNLQLQGGRSGIIGADENTIAAINRQKQGS